MDSNNLEVERAGDFRAFRASGFLVTGFSGSGFLRYDFGLFRAFFRARNKQFRAEFCDEMRVFSTIPISKGVKKERDPSSLEIVKCGAECNAKSSSFAINFYGKLVV